MAKTGRMMLNDHPINLFATPPTSAHATGRYGQLRLIWFRLGSLFRFAYFDEDFPC